MGVYDRKPRPVRVRTDWFRYASRRHDPAFWLEVGRRVSAARIRSTDRHAVAMVVRQMETKRRGMKR